MFINCLIVINRVFFIIIINYYLLNELSLLAASTYQLGTINQQAIEIIKQSLCRFVFIS
jgi:hypothetical protein